MNKTIKKCVMSLTWQGILLTLDISQANIVGHVLNMLFHFILLFTCACQNKNFKYCSYFLNNLLVTYLQNPQRVHVINELIQNTVGTKQQKEN